MILCAYNIAGGLRVKMGILSFMVKERSIDVLVVNEAECSTCPPKLDNYVSYTETSAMETRRIVVYIKETIKARQIHKIQTLLCHTSH